MAPGSFSAGPSGVSRILSLFRFHAELGRSNLCLVFGQCSCASNRDTPESSENCADCRVFHIFALTIRDGRVGT